MERLAAAQGTGQACRRDRRASHGDPVCRMATRSVAWRPRLSHGDPVCRMATPSVHTLGDPSVWAWLRDPVCRRRDGCVACRRQVGACGATEQAAGSGPGAAEALNTREAPACAGARCG